MYDTKHGQIAYEKWCKKVKLQSKKNLAGGLPRNPHGMINRDYDEGYAQHMQRMESNLEYTIVDGNLMSINVEYYRTKEGDILPFMLEINDICLTMDECGTGTARLIDLLELHGLSFEMFKKSVILEIDHKLPYEELYFFSSDYTNNGYDWDRINRVLKNMPDISKAIRWEISVHLAEKDVPYKTLDRAVERWLRPAVKEFLKECKNWNDWRRGIEILVRKGKRKMECLDEDMICDMQKFKREILEKARNLG